MTFLRVVLAGAVLGLSGMPAALAATDAGQSKPQPLIELEAEQPLQAGHENPPVQDKNAHGDKAHSDKGHGAGLPQLNPETYPSQIFWLVVIFMGFYAFLSSKVLPELSTTLEHRRERIDEDLDTAASLKDEAEKVHSAFDEILEEARQQSINRFSDAEKQIKDKTAAAVDRLNEKSSQKIADAENQAEGAKAEAMSEMKAIAADIAAATAEKIVGLSPNRKQAMNVVDKLGKKAA